MAELLRNAQQNVNFIIGPLLGNLLLPKLPSLVSFYKNHLSAELRKWRTIFISYLKKDLLKFSNIVNFRT